MVKRALVVGWVVGIGGCLGADGGAGARCDGQIVADGAACVIRGPISETGFDCPPLMPYEFGGEFGGETWTLCSSDPDLDPQEVADFMAEGGQPDWPDGDGPGDPGGPTDPNGPDGGEVDICGDGVVDDAAPSFEVCDDGNNVGGDGCSADCKSFEVCGNAIVDGGEQCDDGNNINGDACDAQCRFEEDAPCIDVNGDGICEPGEGDPTDPIDPGDLSRCGDGVVDDEAPFLEVCDDGNNVNGDGCDATCRVGDGGGTCVDVDQDGICEPGEGDPVDPGELSRCGDGVVDDEAPFFEVCDDGNMMNGDGCSASCQSLEICGNAVVDPGEQCDDGNNVDGDGCDASCTATGCIDHDGDGICTP